MKHPRRLTNSLIIVGLVTLIIGLYFDFFPYVTTRTWTDIYNIPNDEQAVSPIQLGRGDIYEGQFTVMRGEAIDFSIRDPYGSLILNAGTVTGGRDFSFTAESDGTYTKYFNNIVTTGYKTISDSYTITGAPIRDTWLPIAVVGLILTLFGLSRVGGAYLKEKQAANKPTPQPPPTTSYGHSFVADHP